MRPKKIGRRTVAFAYEQTGGSSVLELWDGGELARSLKGRNRWAKFFREQEIFVPSYFFGGGINSSSLTLEGVDLGEVARVDFFDLGEPEP